MFGDPKTAASRRTLYLEPDLVAALRDHRKRQLAERLRCPEWHDYDLVFPAPLTGKPLHTSVLLRALERDLETLGLEHVTAHMLRHTAATLLLSDGEYINNVQRALGHSDVRTTLSVYGHTMPQAHRDVAKRMRSILDRAAKQEGDEHDSSSG